MTVQSVIEEASKLIIDDLDEGKKLLEDNGYTYIRETDMRIMYSYPDDNKIVKIPINSDGKKLNLRENRIWNDSFESVKSHLAEVYDCHKDGNWLIQEQLTRIVQ
jgi:mRNA-degrading endonuclease RelE of RelBE toxin-antitoxin system